MEAANTMAWTRRGAIIACLVLSGCEQPVPPPASPTQVRAVADHVTNFDSSGSLTREIQARYESDLGFRMVSKVVERPGDIGASVTQGQLLTRMDNQDQRNALKSAQSALTAAEAVLEQTRTQEERMRKLLTNGYTNREKYDDAQQQYSTAQAELTTAQDTQSCTESRADREGAITTKGAEPGQVMAFGQMVVRLVDPKEQDAVFQVAGLRTRLERKAEWPPVDVRLVGDSGPGAGVTTEGTIREVSPGVDPITRTYTVKVSLPDVSATFLLGANIVGRGKMMRTAPRACRPSSRSSRS